MKLEELRNLMKERDIDAYLVPSGDPYGSEYPCDHYKARAFASGFTGSAGTLLVTMDMAGLWTDGRYFLQAADELDGSGIDLFKSGEPGVPTVPEFLAEHMPAGFCLGFDGQVVMTEDVREILAEASKKGEEPRVYYADDLVGMLWEKRPPIPQEEPWDLPMELAGEAEENKELQAAAALEATGADISIIYDLDEVAWLTNKRGNLAKIAPLTVANEKRLAQKQMKGERIAIHLNPAKTNYFTYRKIADSGNYDIIEGPSIIDPMKAVKNAVEIENMRRTHIKDGVAMTKLLYWLKTLPGAPGELDVVAKIEELRSEQEGYLGPSFSTIAGYAEHGAIIHYSPKAGYMNRDGVPLFLIDTGGQYMGGTTDITRTVVMGELTKEQKRAYTAVLKGHLALARAVFLDGSRGSDLDIIARKPINDIGYDYNHGTGHGVGYMLSVHEGPQCITRKRYGIKREDAPMRPGMVTSNEPGIYVEGQFGVRIEGLTLCVQGPDAGTLAFESLTFVPFDRDGILVEDLDEVERAQINAYHREVFEKISPYLKPKEAAWLAEVTAEI